MLNTVDALMLRTVVHKGAADVFHPGNQFDIRNKNSNADNALQDCHNDVGMDDLLAGVCDQQRQDHENADGHDNGKYHNNRHKHLLHLFSEDFVHPEFQLTRFRILIILKEAG